MAELLIVGRASILNARALLISFPTIALTRSSLNNACVRLSMYRAGYWHERLSWERFVLRSRVSLSRRLNFRQCNEERETSKIGLVAVKSI